MHSISDDELATIAILNNEFFYKHFIEDCSDSDSDDDSDLVVGATSILHEESEVHMPQWRGSLAGHVQLFNDNFDPEAALYQNYFWCCFRMLRKLFGRIIEGIRLHD
jgi:hypothetical protein